MIRIELLLSAGGDVLFTVGAVAQYLCIAALTQGVAMAVDHAPPYTPCTTRSTSTAIRIYIHVSFLRFLITPLRTRLVIASTSITSTPPITVTITPTRVLGEEEGGQHSRPVAVGEGGHLCVCVCKWGGEGMCVWEGVCV